MGIARFLGYERRAEGTARRGGAGSDPAARRPGRPRHRPRLDRRPDLGLRPRRDAARLRIRPPLPGTGADPRPRAAPRDAADARPARRLPSSNSHLLSRSAGKREFGGRVRGVGVGSRGRWRCSPWPSATRSSATTCRTATRTPPSPPPASTPPSPGPVTSPTPASPPPAPASTRSSAPTSPTTSPTSAPNAPTAASKPLPPAAPGAKPSTRVDYDYVVTTRDRLEPGKPPVPTRGPLDRRPRSQNRPQKAPHRRLQAHRPPRPLVLFQLRKPWPSGRSRSVAAVVHRRLLVTDPLVGGAGVGGLRSPEASELKT